MGLKMEVEQVIQLLKQVPAEVRDQNKVICTQGQTSQGLMTDHIGTNAGRPGSESIATKKYGDSIRLDRRATETLVLPVCIGTQEKGWQK